MTDQWWSVQGSCVQEGVGVSGAGFLKLYNNVIAITAKKHTFFWCGK